ncbi:hypothetical protein BDN70DRAFT_883498 [Pholiota conissans]|uniref:ARID domain-containing protein n=1 Tax=Pholiota conissans TaxID=109636 RepID=A0A9P5YU42_9AGAR|nr:hypothetical protein BDN70DRAFT_883498 [Pholiota conissans]
MVPQNQGRPQPQTQQSSFPSFANSPAPLDSSAFHFDSPHVAKQMAALTAANQARIAQNSRIAGSPLPPNGTSSGSYLGVNNSHSFPPASHDLLTNSANGHANFGMPNTYGLPQAPNSTSSASFLDATMSQANAVRNQSLSLKQRQQGFLQTLNNVFKRRPLPPQLTGIPNPDYDPSQTPWGILELSKEVGTVVLAGKEVNLFKLWGIVHSSGGSQAVNAANGWGSILHHFDLPEEYPTGPANTPTSVARILFQYYQALLLPFEDFYMKNIGDQHKKAQMAQRPGSMPGHQFPTMGLPGGGGMSNMQQPGTRPITSSGPMAPSIPSANSLNQYPNINQPRPNGSQHLHPVSAPDSHSPIVSSEIESLAHTTDSNLLDQDLQGIKRKHEQEDGSTKRARQKTDPPENGTMLMAMNEDSIPTTRQESQVPAASDPQTRVLKQATRRKIEYVPLKREVDTYGGRDLQAIDQEWQSVVPRRALRDIHDWGVVDIECLCMSVRSRLSIELSYALTTLTVLSTMRGQTQGSGFPIYNCPDLLDDVLDLMEEFAFGGPEANSESEISEGSSKIYTNRELVALVQDIEGNPFAPLQLQQGFKDPKLGPQQRPANIIIAIVNIIRNLATITDNGEYISNHPRLINMLLRLCCVENVDGKPAPVSRNLSLSDLLLIRRETMNVLMGLGSCINLPQNSSSTTMRMTRRAVELIASYLVDPTESVPPLANVQLAGLPPNPNRRPPPLADIALDVFTHFSQNDANRQIITKALPPSTLWLLLENLVHRLPIVDADFLLLQRDYWLGYIEKVVMSIYSLIFLAPFELKQKIKSDRHLGLTHVMFRMAQRVLAMPNDGRGGFVVSARRAVEAMKLLDSAEDVADTSESTAPVLSFGMGFLDGSDSGMEKGTGMLGGNRDIGWEMLMMRDVFQDDILFNELDSLVRVEC